MFRRYDLTPREVQGRQGLGAIALAERSEVDTLAAYVKALGGKLKIIADFGDETYVLGWQGDVRIP